jgi:hypothetical protein
VHFGHIRPALRERLGEPATVELLDLFDRSREEWMDHVTNAVGDRFERRLTEEISKVRVEMAHGFAALRQDMSDGFASLRQEIADQRFDILKWVFLFWVGQFFAVASLMMVMVRYLRP